MNKTSEFIDTYSDDLCYLIDLRNSYLTHPGKKVIYSLFEASISRLFCVFMIGGIESMLKDWNAKDTNNILEPYFSKESNEDRITALTDSFKTNKIDIDEQILKRYLAIKYLRNTITHTKWTESQKNFIIEQGFPTDTKKLTDEHLQKMYAVNNEMMKYIVSIQLKKHIQLGNLQKLPGHERYFTKKQLANFLWLNLEKIGALICEKKEINQNMIEEAVFDWNLFKEINLTNYIDFEKLDSSIAFLQKFVNEKIYPEVPIGAFDFEKISFTKNGNSDLLEGLSKILKLSTTEIPQFIDAFVLGKRCYERMKNDAAISLLKILSKSELSIPVTKVDNELKLAEKIFNLGRLYYNYAEKR